jgi:hypothetical protein
MSKNTVVRFNKGTAAGNYWFNVLFKKAHTRMQAYTKRVKEKYWCSMVTNPCSALYNGQFYGSYTSSDVDFVTCIDITNLEEFPVGTNIILCGRKVSTNESN